MCAVAVTCLSTVLASPSSAAPVFSDGFESGNLSAWSGSAGFAAQQTNVHTGAWAGRASSTGAAAHAWRTFTTQAEIWGRTWFNVESRSGAVNLLSYRKAGGGALLDVGLDKNGRLVAKNAVTGTTHSSAVVVGSGAWHELLVHIKIGTGARFDVSLDGTAVTALGVATNFGTKLAGRFDVGDKKTGRTFRVAFDDVSVANDPGVVVDTTPPSKPTGLTVTVTGPTTTDLAWNASTDTNGVTGYTIYRSEDGVTYAAVGTSPTTTFSDISLQPETTYWWAVEAFDAAGNDSERSDAVTATTPPGSTAEPLGRWSEPLDIGVVAVHAAVLHTGKVLLYQRTTNPTNEVTLLDPATLAMTDVSAPISFEHNMFCGSQIMRPDGDVFVTGGTLWGGKNPQGTEKTAFFDAATETWSSGPAMTARRWYPTGVSLPDGDALVFSGKIDSTAYGETVDRYDADTNSFSTLPAAATLQMQTYPRMFALPDGLIVRVGQEQKTMFFDPAAPSWTDGPMMQLGGRIRGSAVLLPGLDRILAVGGAGPGAVTTATSEILDLSGATPSWSFTGSMQDARRNLNLVLLPDGKVLAVGGNRGTGLYDDPVLTPELYDPGTGTWTQMAEQAGPRAYHSTAVLLPDGRVLSAGQTDGTMQTTAEIYSPPYLFAGPRPTITTAPTSLTYGGSSFTVTTPEADSIDRIALIRGSTVTHGVNFDQRHLSLAFTPGAAAGELTVTGPASALEAPPGWYMLFVIDDAGVPSVAKWVHLA